MIHEVIIREIELCSCGDEGDITVELNGSLFKVYYQMPDYFIKENILSKFHYIQTDIWGRKYKINEIDNCNMLIDLWLVYGHCKLTENKNKLLPIDTIKSGGLCRGEIITLNQDNEVRIDCGILIDVDDEEELNNEYKIGRFVEVSGTFQIYFPNTEYDR